MKISIITLFPQMVSSFFEESIIKRAKERGLVQIELINLRDFGIDDHATVDDRPYAGGAGMILRTDVVANALKKVKTDKALTVLTSAKGKVFDQKKAQEFSTLKHLIIIAGHYEGFDERVLDLVDKEISIGNFVLTGGEIAASAIVDAVVRLVPGVLKKEEALKEESFYEVTVDKLIEVVGENDVLKKLKEKGKQKVQLLEYPHYTRPEVFMDKKVPEVLLSGNHKEIESWRLKKAFEETLKKRPDLLE